MIMTRRDVYVGTLRIWIALCLTCLPLLTGPPRLCYTVGTELFLTITKTLG